MANNLEKKIYIHQNLNKQELRQAVIENKTYKTKPTPELNKDIGLLYYDTILKRILVWDGTQWKMTQFLDDRDLDYGGDTFIEDIWTQTNLIPVSSPGTSPVLEWKSGLTMSHIPNTYSFKPDDYIIDNVVPAYKYGSIYEPVLYYNNGITASSSIDWKLERGVVTLYSGFTSSINEDNPPLLSYWKYIGNKGDLGSGTASSDTTIIKIDDTVASWIPPYNTIPFSYPIVESDIISITVNGVTIYDYIYNSGLSTITLDEDELGYTIDNLDVIQIEINI